ncbi:MAG: alpha/beta hydrolase, partial [Verrucomicrobiota bacterium]
PNAKGPNELRLLEATRAGTGWKIEVLEDEMTDKMRGQVQTIRKKFKFDREVGVKKYAGFSSEFVAVKTLERIWKKKRNFLLFVHGFNNDIEDVLNRADQLSKEYNLEVIPFSWPANGGGLRGVIDYRSDKRDSRVSAGALDRGLEFISLYMRSFNSDAERDVQEQIDADETKKVNLEKRDEFITEQMEERCPFTVNLMLHSMGNYLYKQLMSSSAYRAGGLLFDNVVLAAPDTNNEDHESWVEKIRARRRVYITINENDYALRASRLKAGSQQRARLGHYVKNLAAKNATYVDFTGASWVGDSHAYFHGESVKKNARVKEFFEKALNGKVAEGPLKYDVPKGLYAVK